MGETREWLDSHEGMLNQFAHQDPEDVKELYDLENWEVEDYLAELREQEVEDYYTVNDDRDPMVTKYITTEELKELFNIQD